MSLKVRSCAGARTQLNDKAAGSTPYRAKAGSGGAEPVRRGRGVGRLAKYRSISYSKEAT